MPTTIDIHANGLRFSALSEGEGPPVLLLHGFPDTAHSWDHLRPRLAAAGFRAVSPFMRGYAPTEIPSAPIDLLTLGRDALALLDALGDEPAAIVGHDWGAVATFVAAALAPERISRMVVVGVPHPLAQRPTPQLLWGVRHFFALNLPGAAARIRARDFDDVETLYQRWSPTWRVPEPELLRVVDCLRQPGSIEAAVSYYRVLRSLGPPPEVRRILEPPALGVVGLDDPVVRVPEFERARAFHRDYEVLALPGGHFVHRESPDAFADAVITFLKG